MNDRAIKCHDLPAQRPAALHSHNSPNRLTAAVVMAASIALMSCDRSNDATSNEPLTLFAAASTTDAIAELASLFEQQNGITVRCSFDASSSLARQIHAGAPADIFLSANPQWMDDVEAAGLIESSSRFDLIANQLVLVVPIENQSEIRVTRDEPFVDALPNLERLAMGDPSHVPAGQYARESLDWLGWWNDAESMIIPTLDVRSALRLVELGEADAGIVYETDAAASDRVRIAGTLPPESHFPIRYPIAICANANNQAAAFITFLRSSAANEVFRRHGFEPIAVASESP